jgi:hypothetical protein
MRRSRLSCALVILAIPIILGTVLIVVFNANNRPPNIHIPTPKMPSPNAWDDFQLATRLIGKKHGPLSDPRSSHVWTKAEYESFMRDNAASMTALRKGLTKPYLHPPIRGIHHDYSSYAYYRELARIQGSAAMYYEFIGNPGKAADSCLDGMEFGVVLPRGGSIIAGLVSVAIESICSCQLDRIIEKLSPDDLARVATRLDSIEKKRVPFSDVIIEEGYSSASWYMELFRDPNIIKEIRNPKNWIKSDLSGFGNEPNIWTNIKYAFANKTAALQQNLDYYKAVAAEQKGQYIGKSSVTVPDNILKSLILSDVVRARMPFTKNEAIATLLRTEVALRLYYAENKRYPSSLSEIVPKYLKSELVDPFGMGKPLRYKSLDNGKKFLLYSLGANMTDEGGNPPVKQGDYQSADMVVGKL